MRMIVRDRFSRIMRKRFSGGAIIMGGGNRKSKEIIMKKKNLEIKSTICQNHFSKIITILVNKS